MLPKSRQTATEGDFMAEDKKETGVVTTAETAVEPVAEPKREPTKTSYTCGHCGANVVPREIETPSGKVYRCPKCGKFMKLVGPEEKVKEEKKEEGERGYEDPYQQMINEMAGKLHRELIKTPNVTKEKAAAIVDDFRQDRLLQESDRELYYLILDYSPKAKPGLLARILDRVFSIRDEYEAALAQRPLIRERRPRVERGPVEISSRRRGGRRESIGFRDRGMSDDYDYGDLAYRRDAREDREHELRMKRMEEEHQLRMKRLEAEILKITKETEVAGSKSGGEKLVKVKVGDQEVEVPASQALFYMRRDDSRYNELKRQLEEEREKRHTAEIQVIADKVEDLEKRPGFLEQLDYYERTGHKIGLERGGRTTMDVLDSFRGDLQTTAQQILNKIPSGGQQFKPEVTRTPEERRRKAEEIKRRLRKSEEILKAEDELIKAANKVRSEAAQVKPKVAEKREEEKRPVPRRIIGEAI